MAWLGLLGLQAPAAAQPPREVRVGLYENSPKVVPDVAGSPGGIFVDVLEAIARREGWQLRYVPGTWQQGLERLERGELDLMPDVARTAERMRLYAFHREPVLSSWSQVYAREGASVRALPDLDGRRVAVLRGSVQQAEFMGMVEGFGLQVTLVPTDDFEAAFRAVAERRADAVVTNRYYGARHAAAHRLVDTAIIFSPSQLHFAARRDVDPALLEALDRNLTALKSDSTSDYYESLRRWAVRGAPPAVPAWLWWAASAGAALLLVSVGWSIALRRTAQRLRESDARQRQLLDELARAKEAAEAADRMKSAFLATMSHELRSPLNSVIGFSGILLQGLSGPLNAEQHKQLGMVRGSAEHLLALINDVLDLSKIEAGQLRIRDEPFVLGDSIAAVVDSLQPQVQKKGLSLRAELDPELGTLVSDRRRVEQVLLNLLSNAIKFTEAGGVRVTAERQGDAVSVQVEDTGIGIEPGSLDRLFKPFSQLESSLDRRHEGTGLGLSICKRLVELLGGTIWVESEPGKGSTFGFRLPAVRGG